MPTDLTLRPATLDDSDRIAELYAAARRAAVPAMPPALHTVEEDRAWFAARLVDGRHEAWVAEQDGELVGFTLVTPTWLDGLYVEPGRQRAGVGTALLDLVKAGRPDGFGLWVFETNAPARGFYARHGLVELERTDGSANEEGAPDIKVVWPGRDPEAFFGSMIDEVDDQLGDLRARRTALTRAVQDLRGRPRRTSSGNHLMGSECPAEGP